MEKRGVLWQLLLQVLVQEQCGYQCFIATDMLWVSFLLHSFPFLENGTFNFLVIYPVYILWPEAHPLDIKKVYACCIRSTL